MIDSRHVGQDTLCSRHRHELEIEGELEFDIPSTKSVSVEMHVRPEASVLCEPALRVECLWIWKFHGVPRDRPVVVSADALYSKG